MMNLEEAKREIERWHDALVAELQRQTAGKNIPWAEVSLDLPYHEKLENAMYIIAIGEPPAEGETDYRSLIIGAALEEADVRTSPNRFVPHLVSSEVVEFSEKFKKGRCGYPHHILYALRASGVPSYKSVVKSAIKRSGSEAQVKKPATPSYKPEKPQTSGGNGYLINPIKGTNDVLLHVGMLRMPRDKASRIVAIFEEES